MTFNWCAPCSFTIFHIFIDMETEKKWIYLLKDPRDNSSKYIGMSKDPNKRLKEHIYDTKREKTKKSNWVSKLLKLGLKPQLVILKETNNTYAAYWEEFYIKKFLNDGHKLLNYDETGVGTAKILSEETKKKIKIKLSKKVIQYDLNGNKINEFDSLRDVEKETGINHGNISKCCNGIFKHTGGFIFRKFGDEKEIEQISKPNAIKKEVIEVDADGNTLCEYESISDASNKTKIDSGNISRVCNGKAKKTNNKIFKFKNNE